MRIAMFGSSLVSAYWNGAATYYRGMVRALAARGHQVTFYEPNAYQRQEYRDLDPPSWARVIVYEPTRGEVDRWLQEARGADLLIKTSGIGVLDDHLETAVPAARTGSNMVVYWDVDAPATLTRLRSEQPGPLLDTLASFDRILTYGGGDPVVKDYLALGARSCHPIYNGLDPETHHPVPSEGRYACDLGFLGNRLPDREHRVEEFFLRAADASPRQHFILAGNGWADKPRSKNVSYLGHLPTALHNVFNCSARAVLNICRDSMAAYGFSPATRVFEAAGAGACIITDDWEGIEQFFEPGREILVAKNGAEVAETLAALGPDRAHAIGQAARDKALREHTYTQRAIRFEQAIEGRTSR
ncbi:MAG TPA: glycosyltransferase [Chthoniobacterales bacterium]